MSGMLDRSPIKSRQYPVMIIAVDWDIKHQIKQVSSKLEQLFCGYFCGNIFFLLDLGIVFGLCDKIRIYFRFLKQFLTLFESHKAVAQQFYYDDDISFR